MPISSAQPLTFARCQNPHLLHSVLGFDDDRNRDCGVQSFCGAQLNGNLCLWRALATRSIVVDVIEVLEEIGGSS